MRPWRSRLAVRRTRVQWALVCVVILVAGLAATMLASLFLLSSATERFAARAALDNAPETTIRVSHAITVTGDPQEVIAASGTAALEFFGDVPYSTMVHLQGVVLGIPREGKSLALGYFAFFDGIENAAVLDTGRWPENVSGDTVEAALPFQLLDDLDLSVGDELRVYNFGDRTSATVLDIVGSYRAREPGSDFWRYDAYNGAGYDPKAPVPFSGGRLTAEGFGPLLLAREELVQLSVSNMVIDYIPDFSNATLADVAGLVERSDGAERAAKVEIGANARQVTVISESKATLGRVLGSLAVTRSSVLVMGLLLLVLSIAALAQASRLMAERRHAEQHLMRARGASNRQLLYLAVVEAIVLGAITAIVAPLVANAAYRVVARAGPMVSAGMNRDPGLPPLIWVVTGIVGAVLVIVLISPLLKRGGTFVEGEQARSRPGRVTSLQRSGLDLALVALAALSYLQLRGYKSPVLTSGGVARVDPLLAAGPALTLLAGALVCVRLIPATSKFMEGTASRGRRAVTPLAAWEVGRRSARAVSAILLLTLALSVGSFSMSFLATWKNSQQDQASFLHPADVAISGLAGDVLSQRGRVEDPLLGAVSAPIFESDGEIAASLREGRGGAAFNGRPVHLIATTNQGLAAYTEGRVADEGGRTISDALTLAEDSAVTGIPLPGTPSGVEFSLTLSSSQTALAGLTCTVRVVVIDGNGTYVTLDAGDFPIDGQKRTVRAVVPDLGGSGLAAPVQIMGLQTVWSTRPGANPDRGAVAGEGDLDLSLSIDGISALTKRADVPVPGVGAQYDSVAAEVPEDVTWYGRAEGVVGPSLSPQDDQVHIAMTLPITTLTIRTVSISQGAFPFVEELPVVANTALLSQLGLNVGDGARVALNDVPINVRFVGSVALMPGGNPRNPAIVANLDELQVMLMQGGAPSPGVTGWWTEVPEENLARYLDILPSDATVTTRIGTARALTDDPLRVGIQAALWLVTAAAVILAALGFGVHTVVTVRARELEFAQLRAVGLGRGALTRLIGAESALLAVLGTTFGVGLGVALSYLVAPLVSVGPDGRPPVPDVIVDVPWGTVGLLAAEVGAVLAVVVFLVSLQVRRIDPAALLRVEG